MMKSYRFGRRTENSTSTELKIAAYVGGVELDKRNPTSPGWTHRTAQHILVVVHRGASPIIVGGRALSPGAKLSGAGLRPSAW